MEAFWKHLAFGAAPMRSSALVLTGLDKRSWSDKDVPRGQEAKKGNPDQPRNKAKKNRSDPERAPPYCAAVRGETPLYELWGQWTDRKMTWDGEALGAPIDEDMTLWLSAVREKVAPLAGELRLIAVFPDSDIADRTRHQL
jgi:hypothetical protein